MTTFRKQVLIGVAALGIGIGSIAVHASPGEHGGDGRHGAHGEQKMEHMQERMAKRNTELRAKLNLNAEQQKAWDAYVASMKPGEGHAARPSREEMEKLTAPQRMELMQQRMQQGQQRMTERLAATRTFYGVLTPEQRKVFDENFHMGREHHGKGRHDKS